MRSVYIMELLLKQAIKVVFICLLDIKKILKNIRFSLNNCRIEFLHTRIFFKEDSYACLVFLYTKQRPCKKHVWYSQLGIGELT